MSVFKQKKNSRFTRTLILVLLKGFFSVLSKNKKNFKKNSVRGNYDLQQKTIPKLVCGFTLIESMVAIAVLLLAITGPLVMVRQGLASSRVAKNQVAAFYLAQDAMEYVRAVRDSNILSGANWLNGLASCVGGFCQVDVPLGTISSCGFECVKLKKSSGGLYGYSIGWTDTGFRRKVQIYPSATNSDEVFVEVEILWDGDTRNFKVRESLFNLN